MTHHFCVILAVPKKAPNVVVDDLQPEHQTRYLKTKKLKVGDLEADWDQFVGLLFFFFKSWGAGFFTFIHGIQLFVAKYHDILGEEEPLEPFNQMVQNVLRMHLYYSKFHRTTGFCYIVRQ